MNEDSTTSVENKEQLKVEETDDSCTREFVSGDWSDEVKQENLTVVKQEPDDVCGVIFATFTVSQQKEYVQILGVG